MDLVLTRGIYECSDHQSWPEYIDEMKIFGRNILKVYDGPESVYQWTDEPDDLSRKSYALEHLVGDEETFSWRDTWIIPLKRRYK